MHRVTAVLLAALLLPFTASAGQLGAYGAYWAPDDAESGYGYGAKLSLGFLPFLQLEARASVFDDLSEDISAPGGQRIDLDLEDTVLELGLLAELPTLGAGIVPYLGGGLGYHMLDLTVQGSGRETHEAVVRFIQENLADWS